MPQETSSNGPTAGPDDPKSNDSDGASAIAESGVKTAEGSRAERWLDELIAEQRSRWLQGDRGTCRDYLARGDHPLCADRVAAAELIYHEFLLRQESGEAPEFEEHVSRYPEYAAEVLMFREAYLALGEVPVPAREGEIGRVGDYVLLELISRGGMGVVFKARQVSLNRIIALKMLPDHCAASPETLERIRIEATAAAGLSHPNIVAVHAVGEHAGQPYLVMEYVEGKNPADLTREHPLAPAQAATLLFKLAGAVHHAHEHGTLHRDLKPSNIIVDHRGEPRITDFGLARLGAGDSHPTLTGQVLGTPSYMPPEQADQKSPQVGPASDVYGLGATLYELLTARPPFQGQTPLETLKLVIETEPIPPRLLAPKVPRDLETICLKCLRKDPLERYASAQDLALDLARFLEGRPVHARQATWWERGTKLLKRRWREFALATACLVTVVALTWQRFAELRHAAARAQHDLALTRERAQKEKAGAEARSAKQTAVWQEFRSLENGVREQRTSRPPTWTWSCLADLARAAALAPEASKLIDLRREAALCLAGVDVRKVSAWEMGGGAQVDRVAFDGRRLAMAQLRGVVVRLVRLVDISRGQSQDLAYPGPWQLDAGNTGGGNLAFSPDGRWLVLGTRQGDLYAWDTSLPRPARVDRRGAHKQWVRGLAFHPDGKTLISSSDDKTLECWDYSSGWKNVATAQFDGDVGEIALSPDGKRIACCSGELKLCDARGLRSGKLAMNARREFPGWAMCARFSPDGRFLAATDDRHVSLLDADSLELVRTFRDPDLEDAAHEFDITNVGFSPDGSLLFSSAWDRTIKLWEAATGRLLAVIRQGSEDREIVFAAMSPQGRHLTATNGFQTILYELGGLDVQTTIAQHAETVRAIDLSPDGETLACVTDGRAPGLEHRGALELWDVASGQLKSQQAISGQHAGVFRGSVAFHPGGSQLVFSQSTREIFLSRPDSGKDRLTMGVSEPPFCLAFSRDGKTLWAGVGKGLDSWSLPDLALRSRWTNEEGEYLKGWSGIACVAAGKRWLVAGSHDATTRVFRVDDGRRPLGSWPSPGGSISSIALSRDETFAVVGTQSGHVRVVRVPGGETIADLAGHQQDVTSVAMSADDQMLASASLDRTIRLWQRRGDSFQELLTLVSPTGGILAVRFSKGGDQLAFLVKNEPAVRIWHLDLLKQRLDSMNLGW